MKLRYFLSAAAVLAGAGILMFPGELSGALRDSISACIDVMIPALFAFTVLAVYLQQSGLYLTALRPLTLPLSKLLGIPEELCAVYLLANIGGYPVGVKLLRVLVSRGRLSRSGAGRMLCFCYGSGPSFVIGTAGMRVFGSAAVGGIIYAACLLSSLVTAVIVCRCGGGITLTGEPQAPDLSADRFIDSVDRGGRVMYTVCVMSVAFGAVNALLERAGITGAAAALLGLAGVGVNSDRVIPALLEVSMVKDILPAAAAAPLCAAILSFGGVCVLLQVSAIGGGEIPLKPLLISRIPAALLSAALSLPACFIETPSEVMNAEAPQAAVFSVNAGMSVCVMIMAAILIASRRQPVRFGFTKK